MDTRPITVTYTILYRDLYVPPKTETLEWFRERKPLLIEIKQLILVREGVIENWHNPYNGDMNPCIFISEAKDSDGYDIV